MQTRSALARHHACSLRAPARASAAQMRRSTRVAVATARPVVLQSLDMISAEESWVEGLGVVPESWGVPAGRLYSEGKHVCDLPALKHLGISFETGALEMGRDHYSGALLTAVLSRLQRHHVGYWLFDAARKPEAAYLFECQPVLKSWLMQLAEQRHGKGRYLIVEQGNESAQQSAGWLQSLSCSFGKELHNIPVAFKHDTAASARQLLFAWLLELPEAQPGHKEEGAEGLTASQNLTKNLLEDIATLLPHKPKLLVKQLPSAGSPAFAARVQSTVPAAAALAAAATHSPASKAAAGTATAAGWVDGTACVCVAAGLLDAPPASAAFHMVMAAKDGLQLNASNCAAAIDAVATATVAPVTYSAQAPHAEPVRTSATSGLFGKAAVAMTDDAEMPEFVAVAV